MKIPFTFFSITVLVFLCQGKAVAQAPILTGTLHAYPTYVGLGYTQDDMNLEFDFILGDPDEDDLAYGAKIGYRLNLLKEYNASLFIVPRVGYSFGEFIDENVFSGETNSYTREGLMYEAGIGFTADGYGLSFAYGYDEVSQLDIYAFKLYVSMW